MAQSDQRRSKSLVDVGAVHAEQSKLTRGKRFA